MEIARNFLLYGDAVDLHDVDDYKNTTNYISDDGLSGFAITKDGDLISVFSLRKGFLRTVGDYIVEKGAKTLDCYDSEVQHLPEFYAKFLKGFKPVASVDFNYDMLKEYRGKAYADTYVKIYGESPVVLMAKLDNDVEYKHFGKDDWDSAESYRAQMIENDKVDAKTSTDFFDAQKSETYTPATEEKAVVEAPKTEQNTMQNADAQTIAETNPVKPNAEIVASKTKSEEMVDQLDAQKVMTSKSKSTKKANASIENNIETVYNDYRNIDKSGGNSYGRIGMENGTQAEENTGRDRVVREIPERAGGVRQGFSQSVLEGRFTDRRNRVLYQSVSHDNYSKAIKRTKSDVLELYDVSDDYELFSESLEKAKANNPHGFMVDSQSVDALKEKGAKTFLTKDGTAGGLVTKDGDIEGIFKDPKNNHSKKAVNSLMLTAIINGGIKLDCYGADLVRKYNPSGMEAVGRVEYAFGYNPEMDEFVKETYISKGLPAPDVFAMKLRDGVTAKDVSEKMGLEEFEGGFHVQSEEELKKLPLYEGDNSYFDMLDARDELIKSTKVDAKTSTDFFDAQKTETYTPATEKKAEQYPNDTGAMESEPMSISANANKSGTFSEQREKAGKTPKNTYTNLDNYLDNNDVSDEAKIILQGKYKDDYIEGKVADKVVQEVNEGYNFTEKQNFLLFFKIYIAFLSDMCYS